MAKAESGHRRIDLNQGFIRPRKLCEDVLRAFDLWPEDEIQGILWGSKCQRTTRVSREF